MAAAPVLAPPPSVAGGAAPAFAQVGGELSGLESHVAANPDDLASRSQLARAYSERGFIAEAVAQYLELAARDPTDQGSREQIAGLVRRQMPTWLPGRAESLAPFRHSTLDLVLAGPQVGQLRDLPANAAAESPLARLLVTEEGFPAIEGQSHDGVHKWLFPWVDYGYHWSPSSARWLMRARVHWGRAEDAVLARSALTTTLAFCAVTQERLGADPSRSSRGRSQRPVEVWVCEGGEPGLPAAPVKGARSVGRDIYLYSAGITRAPAEWFRELAHEYGHVAFPGIGGFTDTDDPWADGCLAELLFPKWLAAGPEWLPWPASEAERQAASRRQELIARVRATGPDARLLAGTDTGARDHFLGLALWLEEWAGPRALGDALRQCSRGRAADFAAAAESAARARGLELWPVKNAQP